jgi:glucose-6-phosphate 1-dehydrogenase
VLLGKVKFSKFQNVIAFQEMSYSNQYIFTPSSVGFVFTYLNHSKLLENAQRKIVEKIFGTQQQYVLVNDICLRLQALFSKVIIG